MKRITPNISVENCNEALEFYRDVFGGEIKNVQHANNIEMFKGQEGKIIHSELHVNENCIFYFVDFLGNKSIGNNVQLILELNDFEEIQKIYDKLKEEGNVIFELQKTFWGAFHAVVVDKYGVSWGLNYMEMK
ncbi:hypothetical protein ABG79_00002 [Caloramator mitchellensis]|uniref:Glyoxalase/fosfomycin resistance/dioxygenase domain-containing protein n=1 Tax=Caloramator mitchellensis TaxID=908809 RepID=A0A0R3JZX9_CALMK|nr:VOC family protein [Caloramator mitchellensis]KRQ87837.1 hypothetical protein ABG79_00002 [Caloramator mitchellensis]